MVNVGPAATIVLPLSVIDPPTTLAPVIVPVTDAELPVITPPTTEEAVTVPVVETLFDPNVAKLALVYPAGNPVNPDPLPIMYAPVILPVTLTVVPVWSVAEILPPVILPVALTVPPVAKLPPVIVPVTDMLPVVVCPTVTTALPPTVNCPAAVAIAVPPM